MDRLAIADHPIVLFNAHPAAEDPMDTAMRDDEGRFAFLLQNPVYAPFDLEKKALRLFVALRKGV